MLRNFDGDGPVIRAHEDRVRKVKELDQPLGCLCDVFGACAPTLGPSVTPAYIQRLSYVALAFAHLCPARLRLHATAQRLCQPNPPPALTLIMNSPREGKGSLA